MTGLILGCGYLGRRVASLWLAEGRTVFATTRNAGRAEELRRDGLIPVVCDVLDPESLRRLPAVDVVVYAVGFDRTAGRSMRQVYVEGLGHVLDIMPTPGRFVHVSSVSVYGQTSGEEVDETALTEPVEESGRVVLDAETLLRSRQPNAIILRFAGIYGPGRWLRKETVEKGEPIPADPEGWLNLIHVEDGAQAVLLAAARGVPGAVYNVSDGHPVRRRDFYEHMAMILGAPPPRFTTPAGADGANRRVVSRRPREELGFMPRYPSYVEGLGTGQSQS